MSFLRYLSAFLIVLITSCEVFDKDEKIPSYIHIDKFDFTTTSEQGSSSNKITDAWVYIDDQVIGAFELPVTFPVLWEGTHTITVKPGIKLNGIAGARAIYPFYKPFSKSITLYPDSIIKIAPTSSFSDAAKIVWYEAFEDGGITLEKTYRSDTNIFKTSDITKRFEGDYSGIVNMDADHEFFEIKSSTSYILPQGGSAVFLELNYKCNQEFSVGVFANTPSQSLQSEVLIINKSDTWNKIYVNLTGRVSANSDAINYNVFFGAFKSADVAVPEILLDNIRLVHF